MSNIKDFEIENGVLIGYVGENGGAQTAEVAHNMRYLVAVLFLVSAILEFIGLAIVYNLDKKTLAKMNEALGRDVEADDVIVYDSAEDSDNLVG